MKNFRLAVSLALIFQPLLAQAQQPDIYTIDAKLLSCPKGQAVLKSREMQTTTVSSAVMLFDDVESLERLTNSSILTAPRVIAAANQTAILTVVADEDPQYFEKSANGSFQLRRMTNANQGVRITVTVAPANGVDVVGLDAEVQVTSILWREKIPGVALDVGRPTLSHQSMQLSVGVGLGKWVAGLVPNSDANADRTMLFLLRVQRGKK